jgi:excisionase family DNA binding protein|tara:strand:- start:576 stop:722 length:147 start_codon:yes stop_codon:yes gene_type:complete
MSYIKVSEAADRIGVSLVTAKRMISDGRLVGEKIGILVRAMDSKVSNS